MKKAEKLNIRNEEFCRKYLKPGWDGCAANEYFIRQCDPNPEVKFHGKPNHEPFDGLRNIYYAQNGAYLAIDSAYVKSKLVEQIKSLLSAEVPLPQQVFDKEEYIEVYRNTLTGILNKIDAEAYDFQKTKL